MASLESLLDRRTLDAAVAWALTGLLGLAAAWFYRVGEPEWTGLVAVLVGVVVLVPALADDPMVTVPSELLAVVALPIALRAAGFVPALTTFFAIAGVALLGTLVLDAFTSLELSPRFAVVFVVVVTMAVAGVWTVVIFAADTLVGTSLLAGQTELMWDLVGGTAAGVLAGLVFGLYFRYSNRVERLRGRPQAVSGDDHDGESLPGDGSHHTIAVRAMQFLLVGIAAVAVAAGNVTLLVNSAVPLCITLVPGLLRREYEYAMDTGLVLWLSLAATFHGAGAARLYGTFGWYDSLAHVLSATLVAGIGYTVARAVERHSGAVRFTDGFRATFVVLFVLAVGVAWEMLEFASGGLAALVGGEALLAQYGTADIVNDLVFNTVGAGVVALGSSAHFEGVAARFAEWLRRRRGE